ncbi:peptidoglycan-binding protein [Geothrix oryzae]|uniref:Peptidoglycan-binding protein n=1 Tax=Geothrix oryzae TaxID=2927975 RepID=A0ABN6UW15_9BACT|nr:NlpC/P60 family protein [Geothrix oryzae]BDU68942.1 peptidoglycan-binding protein [Geothrix oryzae]
MKMGRGAGKILMALLVLTAACSRAPHPLPERTPPERPRGTAARALPRLGYTLQAGAFAKVENAARFAESLQAQGLEATYYASGEGLYRVRFGDFATREKARARGEALKRAGVIEAFWVVAPDGSAPGASGRPQIHPADERGLRASLVETARGYLGVPYLFGGTTERGFDCSGLTGAVYRLNGLRLPRSSQAQFEAGSPVDLEQARAGDLLFFAPGGGRVSHVGLYVGQGAFIHAPSAGRGICQDQLSDRYYQKAFVGARTYL